MNIDTEFDIISEGLLITKETPKNDTVLKRLLSYLFMESEPVTTFTYHINIRNGSVFRATIKAKGYLFAQDIINYKIQVTGEAKNLYNLATKAK